MLKKILNKKEIEVFNYTARPFVMHCLLVCIIVVIGSNFGTVTPDEVDGYVGSLLLYFLVNYLNLSYIELREKIHNK